MYDDRVRQQLRDAVERIVKAQCDASGFPAPPASEYTDPFPLTDNSQGVGRDEITEVLLQAHHSDDRTPM